MSEPVPDLGAYVPRNFTRGRPALVELAWIVVQAIFVSSFIPGSWHRRALLKAFGAKIGAKVVLKPGIRVKFPWRLSIGDNSWIGEHAWIDNLAQVTIGSDCCVSQDAYLCTGSHDWTTPGFDLITRPITLEPGAWVAARATVGPGVTVGRGAILGLGSTATGNLNPWMVYSGTPAIAVKQRILNQDV